MMRVVVSILCVVLAFNSLAARQDDAAKKDLKALQGDWIMAALEVNGVDVPANKLEGTVLAIKDNRYVVKVKDKLVTTAILELNPKTDPKQLDMTPQDGDKKDKLMRAIYKIEGDTFKMARGLNPEQERPTQFATWPDTNYFVVTWKRK